LVYLCERKGLPSLDAQRAALREAGLTDEELAEAYIDRRTRKPRPGETAQPARDYIRGAARGGDEVWVMRPAVIATTLDDALAWVAEICDQGATLRIASTGESYNCPSAVAPQIADGLRLAAAIREDERKAVLERARKGLRGKPAGKPKISAERLEAARVHWFDQTIDGDEAARRTGIGRRTLHRYFGPRETPAFGKPRGRKLR
jgi:DNA invertase Pin-like site-specific DNA recombinase